MSAIPSWFRSSFLILEVIWPLWFTKNVLLFVENYFVEVLGMFRVIFIFIFLLYNLELYLYTYIIYLINQPTYESFIRLGEFYSKVCV